MAPLTILARVKKCQNFDSVTWNETFRTRTYRTRWSNERKKTQAANILIFETSQDL